MRTAEAAMLRGPAATYPFGRSVHGAFSRVAARFPDRPALVTSGRTITYSALATAGRRVAAHLAEFGVAQGDVVPVVLPRSPELIAALLGVLLRGAAYCALDPRWPQAQQESVAMAVNARMAVAVRPLAGLPCWSAKPGLFEDTRPPRLVAVEDGDSPCCVFLTSGSTGTPKPVLSPHRATTRLFAPDGGMLAGLGPSACMPQWAPQPWDGFSLELWSMLLTGGTSMLCDDRLPTPTVLRQMIADGVDSAWFTSSLFNLIVDEDIDAFHGLRQVWTGGERLSAKHVRQFLDRHESCALINGYGPAESCVFVTTHRVRRADCEDPYGIPLGTPVAGTAVLVLDGDRVCGRGEPGEICVAGDGLALGYLGDADLTAKRFVPIRVGDREERVYRTGDQGEIGVDGLLRFLGRVDRQVKLRGFRVELGEVEANLRAGEGVADAVVLAARDESGACIGLTGFYVPGPAAGADAGSVRAALLRRVPAHLVPDRLLAVPQIPVTANGKADHAALTEIAARTADSVAAPSVTAADPALDELMALVRGVTGAPCTPSTRLDPGSLTSLQVMRLCVRLDERFGVAVDPEEVIAAGTVGALADLVGQGREPSAANPSRTESQPSEARMALADTQVGFLIEHEMRPDGTAGHCLTAWLVDGDFDPGVFRAALADVQQRHEALRARYVAGLEPYLVVQNGSAVELVELGDFPDADSAWGRARTDLLRPLDIGGGEVWRGCHARVAATLGADRHGADQHLVALAIHHIAYDGWAESVLVEDLSVAYAARRAGQAPRFSRPARLDAAIAARRTHISTDDAVRRYWRELLADVPMHEGIKGVVGPPAQGVAVRSHRLPVRLIDGVDRVAAELRVTRFPVLVAAYATALVETLGQQDFVIGTPVSVRRSASQANVLTCLVDTVCLRLGAGSIRETVGQAHRQMSAARGPYALPFPEVVRALNPPRWRGRNPLFRTMLAYQDNEHHALELNPASVSLYRRVAPEPMSELVVEVWPDPAGVRLDALFFEQALPTDEVAELLEAFARTLERL